MQTVIDIRMMAAADIPAVLEIQAVCYTEVTPESNESLHAKLSASQSTCFIASLEGDIVGYLISLAGVTSDDWGDEVDFIVDWQATEKIHVIGVAGVLFPGEAAEQWVGGGDNWLYSMLYASYAF